MIKTIPPEIIDEIFQLLPQGSLPQVSRLSRQFNAIATKTLYHHIELKSLNQIASCFQTLLAKHRLAQTVHKLDIAIWEPGPLIPAFYELLSRGLTCVSGNLTHLWLDDRVRDFFKEIGVIKFPLLVYFSTTLQPTTTLTFWLELNCTIERLEFHGDWTVGFNPSERPLLNTLLPRLVKLTGPPQLVEDLIPGSFISSVAIISRPLESIHPILCSRVARALARTNTPIISLTITYPLVTERFFEEISNHLPCLRRFNVRMLEVSLIASPQTEKLYHWIFQILSKAPHLREIELTSPIHPSIQPMSWQHLQREYKILLHWSQTAKNLEICQMPSGMWWGQLKESPNKLIDERKWIPALATYEISLQAQRAWWLSKLWDFPELESIMRRVEENGTVEVANFLQGAWGTSAWKSGGHRSVFDWATLRSDL